MELRLPVNLQELLDQPVLLGATALAGLLLLLLLFKCSGGAAGGASSKKADAHKPQQPRQMGAFTRAEVAKHTTEGDLWLIIQNKGHPEPKVYDVSAYVDDHPGGDAIFWHAGGDATAGFLGPQHPPTTYDLLEEFCIGTLID